MNPNNLTKYYYTLTEDLKRISQSSNTLEELSRMIYSSEWLRVFLIGDVKTQRISIEVELSFPFSLLYDDEADFIHGKEKEKSTNLRKIMEQQISNLSYLMRLNDIGFTLGFIKDEGCLWVAEKMLEAEPTDALCKVIFPSPSH